MRRWLPFIVPFFTLLFIGGMGMFFAKGGWSAPRSTPVEMRFEDLSLDEQTVRVDIMAHYEALVKQTVPESLFTDEQTLYLFGAFAPYDSDGRSVRLLVRTPRPPERLVSYEMMTIEGRLERPIPEKVPYSTEQLFGKHADYFFSDDVLLIEPWRITLDGEVWELPE